MRNRQLCTKRQIRWCVAAAALIASLATMLARAEAPVSIAYQVLTYDASVAGAPAGTATLALRRDASGYRIVGKARAQGLLDAISPWSSRFRVHGTWVAGQPQPLTFHYRERGRDKRRDVLVNDGTLRVRKNGKQRPEREALPGWDVLTALFASGECQQSLDLHTGRHAYRLVSADAVQPADTSCHYQVTDEDNDTFSTRIRFTDRKQGHRVPQRIEVSGALSGVLLLRESRERNGQCGVSAAAPLDYLCADTHQVVAFNDRSR